MFKRSLILLAVMLFVSLGQAGAEEYRAIFWNLESGESDAALIASQMAAKGRIDFWGLSEVEGQTAVDQFEAAIESANPGVDYIAKMSEDGGSDRLAILYRSDRLTSVPYSGDAAVDDIGENFFEVDAINVGGTVRPALGIQLQSSSGDMVIVLVNHWKCCGGPSNEQRREMQAIQMNAFAVATMATPIISGGDFNIPLDGDGQTKPAFLELLQVWEYKEPELVVGTHKGGSLLDAVFVTNKPAGWESTVTILERDGNVSATTDTFSDSQAETDHRPVLYVVKSDVEERLDAIRETIADLEAALVRLRAELERLEAAVQ